jgi:hypothetical protein
MLFEKLIGRAVEKYLAARLHNFMTSLPEGYHPQREILGADTFTVQTVWAGEPVTVLCRAIGAGEHCHGVSLFDAGSRAVKSEDFEAWKKYLNMLEHYCRAGLVTPSFEELYKLREWDKVTELKKAEIAKMRLMIRNESDDTAAAAMTKDTDRLELGLGYCLPVEFMQPAAFEYTRRLVSRQPTEDELIQAYSLGKQYGARASEFVTGSFPDFAKNTIDIMAFYFWDKKYGVKDKPK